MKNVREVKQVKMRVLYILIYVLMLAIILCGCANISNQEHSTQIKTAGLSMHFMKDDYSFYFVKAFSKRMNELGLKYHITDGMGDPQKQLADIETLLSQGVEVIVVCPMDENIIRNCLNEAIESGVAIISITKIPGINVASEISGGDFQNGKKIGEYMLETLGGQGKIVITDLDRKSVV